MFLFSRNKQTFKYEILATWILLIISWVYFIYWWRNDIYLLIAAIFWLYMAINIWANDIANNMWPAVWSKAITITWALIIAAIFEASWAIIAGWDVVNTIKWWIIDGAQLINNPTMFIQIMISTLLWAAIWLNLATFFKAPVSTTHSIVWWLVWAWITAMWIQIVNWSKIWEIVVSWIISPIMWWIISVILLISIRNTILIKKEIWDAAKRWVPIYVWIMSWVFCMYLLLKWLHPLLKSNEKLTHIITPSSTLFIWIIVWIWVNILLSLKYKKEWSLFKNSKKFINKLFNIPLIFAVSLLSFAHWANDLANAIWPLAAINDTIKNHIVSNWNIWVPLWIMILWAIWLVLWLSIFGGRLIKTVGWEITKLNQIRAFCVTLGAAITVIIASQLWLPVSSTHIAIGWIFWVWLLREYLKNQDWDDTSYIEKGMIKSIALAWIITLPISWILSSITYIILTKIG